MINGINGTENTIFANFIGTDVNGYTARGNLNGVVLRDGASNNIIGMHNLISGNNDSGVQIVGFGTTGNHVLGNYIGTNSLGTAALGNLDGIWLGEGAANNNIGGFTPEDRNIISGNDTFGVSINHIGTSGNLVHGNFIGTDWSGTNALPNGGGVVFTQGAGENSIG